MLGDQVSYIKKNKREKKSRKKKTERREEREEKCICPYFINKQIHFICGSIELKFGGEV